MSCFSPGTAPAKTMPGSCSSSARSPARRAGWSSTIRTDSGAMTTGCFARQCVDMGVAADPLASRYPPLRRDQPSPDGVAREVDPVAHLELLEDVRPMAVDGLAADDQHRGDLVARVPFGDQLEDLELARGQRIQSGRLAVLRALEE